MGTVSILVKNNEENTLYLTRVLVLYGVPTIKSVF